jgi:hypothetical protein
MEIFFLDEKMKGGTLAFAHYVNFSREGKKLHDMSTSRLAP